MRWEWSMLAWILGIGLGVLILYGLHRLGIWMEDKGWIYYLRKSRQGSSVGSLLELQKALEPQIEHVVEHREKKANRTEKQRESDGERLEGTH